jgi:hypothetical protein
MSEENSGIIREIECSSVEIGFRQFDRKSTEPGEKRTFSCVKVSVVVPGHGDLLLELHDGSVFYLQRTKFDMWMTTP